MANQSTQIISQLQNRIGSANWQNWQTHRWQFYDYVRYNVAGVSQLQFFVNPQGAADPVSTNGKSLEETNCPKARSFGQVYFVIQQIRTHIDLLPKSRQATGIKDQNNLIGNLWSPTMKTLERLSHQGVLNIKIGQKDYYDIDQPFINCPPGFGPQITQHASYANTSPSVWFLQSDRLGDVYNVTPPQMIEPEQTIDLTIDFPNANSPAIAQVNSTDVRLNIGVILDGYIARPAQ